MMTRTQLQKKRERKNARRLSVHQSIDRHGPRHIQRKLSVPKVVPQQTGLIEDIKAFVWYVLQAIRRLFLRIW